ncbi:FliH/SctL family protein [Acetobacterium malicum]|uniref:FliH/SctL family protein n=1 Tax=Acetobacterium malicum TaxID=52692 RepID=UPI003593D6F0
MSSIVKAKWVSQITAPVVLPVAHQPETETDNVDRVIHNEEIAENRIDHDESVEAMHAANELMKEAIRASQEIKEKSQETGYQEGFSQGYATGHEEGLRDGTQEGFQAGLKEGLNEGLAQAAAEIENKLREIDVILEQINLERQRALDNQEQELLDIAFEIAKKIMKHQVQEDRDLFLKFFDEVIHGDEEDLKIYLSENQKTLDLHINKEMSEKLKKLAKKSKVIILKDEDKIMVETNDSVIDMSLPVQLDQLEKAIEQSS